MQWGNKPFDFVDIRMEDIEQELQETGDEPLIQMMQKVRYHLPSATISRYLSM